MKSQLKIGAYLRVSTDRQVQVFEGSLDTQKYRMTEFVKNKNKELKKWGEIIDFYVDEGLSAGTSKRPQYQRLMQDVRSGKVNLILVSDLSRLSRNVHDFSVLLKELEQNNASYLSMKEQFDTTTPAGRLMVNMVVNMAQFEREQTSERVAINVSSRAMRGYTSGGKTPFGYDRDPDRPGSFTVNEKEAKDVRAIFRVFLERGSVGKAIPVIEALGIQPRPTRTKDRGIIPGKWGYEQLKTLLSNTAYVGIKEVNKLNRGEDPDSLKPWELYQQVKASWPAIIDEKEFQEVQGVLEESLLMERRRTNGIERRIFLLSGILHCGECGKALTGQSSHGSQSVHRYYAHVEKRISNVTCSSKRIRADEIEQVIINHFSEAVSRAGYFSNLEAKISEGMKSEPARLNEQVDIARNALKKIEAEIAATFRFQMQGAGGSEAALLTAQHLEKLGRERKVVQSRILELEEVEANQKNAGELRIVLEDKLRQFKKSFHKASPATKRRMIRKVLWKLVYQPNGIDAYFNFESDEGLPKKEIDKKVEPGNLVHLTQKKQAKPALSLSFEFLRVEGIGWGGRSQQRTFLS